VRRRTISILAVVFGLAVLAATSGFSLSAQAQEIRTIDPTGRWVTDQGDFLSSSEERLLSAKLAGYADSTSTQIVIVTVQDLGGYAPVDYATELGRKWGVGQEGDDNGVVILVSREEREVFIAPGYGLEGVIPDALAGRIVRNVLVPQFRAGAFYQGLDEAVNALILAASGEFTADDIAADRPRGGPPIDPAVIFIIMIFIVFAISALRNRGGGGGGGYRRRSHGAWPIIFWGGMGGHHRGGGFGGGGFGGFGGGGFGGFGGGGGSFGGGGAGGSW